MFHKYKSFLLLLFSFVLYVDAEEGNCIITDPDYVENWENGDIWINVNDTDFNFQIPIQTKNIKDITIDHKYMEASVANDVLTFSAKPEFQKFIQNEESLKYQRVQPVFLCEKGDNINDKYIRLNVAQKQQFPPKFTIEEYNFHLAMPILANKVIESTAMTVEDFNIDEKLTFALSGGDAECANYLDFTESTRVKKMHTTKLKTKNAMNLEKNITCQVQVTDSSGKTDNAKMTITVDVENSKVPDPTFKEPIQIVNYVGNLKTSVELISAVYTPTPTIRNDNKYAKYFEPRVVANNKIEIVLNGDIPEDEFGDDNYFVLVVEVEYDKADNKGKTAILVDLNKKTTTTTTSTTSTTSTTEGSTTPCDCSTVTPDPEHSTTVCPPCPECTTTVDPGNTTTCPSSPSTCPTCPETTTASSSETTCPTICPECPETSTLPGEGTTCPSCPETTTCPLTCPTCPETTTSGEGISCPECPTTCPTCPETTTSGEGTSCPECPITCPETTTTNSQFPTTCPTCPETSTSPNEGSTASSCPETTTCPLTCPEIPETTPSGEGTSCPECPTTCPSCPETTLPGESTTCPSNPECPSTDLPTSSLGTTPSTSSTTTCAPWEPAPEVRFLTKSLLVNLDKGSTGFVEKFKAVSDISNEKITYAIETVEPTNVKNMFEITQLGEVNIVKELDEGTYKITLTAFGEESKSTDKATLFLIIKHTVINCPDNSIQVARLVNTKVKEGEAKKLIDANGNRFEFTTDNDDILDWFKFNENNGALEVLEIDREDKRIKHLLAPQIQVKIRALPKNTPPMLRHNFSAISTSQYEDEYSCLAIKNIDTESDTMLVIVTVEDVNDSPPVFNEDSPLIVGYPETKLINLIAPPYLVKVTATDEDIGINAKIKYTTNNKNFVADAENGIIFLGSELSDNTEFKVIAEDNDGNNGNKAELVINVKLLKEEHISVITVENIAYSEIEDLIEEISSLTKQTVKYLSSTALPKIIEEESEDSEETEDTKESKQKSLFKMYSDDEKIPAIRIILYALNNKNEVIPAKDFKEIADGTDLGVEIKVQEYAAVSPGDQHQGGDNSGWIAAVSTLSVLLALVIIGGLLGYIFYLRPRMMESVSDGYQKHVHRDSVSVHSSSIETKMEVANTLADRRPTGFPTGFQPQDLDEEDEVFDTIQEENTDTGIDIKDNESITSSSSSDSSSTATSTSTSTSRSGNSEESKPKSRVGVKFDTNVTEIEIEEF